MPSLAMINILNGVAAVKTLEQNVSPVRQSERDNNEGELPFHCGPSGVSN